ncbi:MAG: gene transfer agent family protein [Sphingomonadales bacterium]|nr:gene transfer agent family protein [Sphingomonadales bacterium]MDE2568772.1 gene transfer agent family protein [Sphingomonadales bacterium]
MSPNPWRGEVALVLGGVSHALRPSFTALVAAEEEIGPLFALVERTGAGQLRLGEMVALFWHCLANREHVTREGFAEAVARSGLAACTPALRALMVQVLKGGE